MNWHINRGTYNDQRWEGLDADGRPTGRFLPAEENFPPIGPFAVLPATEVEINERGMVFHKPTPPAAPGPASPPP